MNSRSRGALLAVVAVALLAAGCGGSADDSPSAADWADDVCSAMSTWIDSASSATESLGGSGLSQEGIENAVDDVREASRTLADDLQEAGRPETDAGQEAEASIDQLADDVETNLQKLEDAVEDVSGASEVLNAVSLITGTLSTMANQIAGAFEELGQLDAAGELEQAFEESDACADLRSG